jgi:hypothetical protein
VFMNPAFLLLFRWRLGFRHELVAQNREQFHR